MSSDPGCFSRNSSTPVTPDTLPPECFHFPSLYSWFHMSPAGLVAPPWVLLRDHPRPLAEMLLCSLPQAAFVLCFPFGLKAPVCPCPSPATLVGLSPGPSARHGGRECDGCRWSRDAPEQPPGGGIVPNFARRPGPGLHCSSILLGAGVPRPWSLAGKWGYFDGLPHVANRCAASACLVLGQAGP